jgi:hypothetical protein
MIARMVVRRAVRQSRRNSRARRPRPAVRVIVIPAARRVQAVRSERTARPAWADVSAWRA